MLPKNCSCVVYYYIENMVLPAVGDQTHLALPWIFVSKNTNYKQQISNKSQIPIFNSAVVAKRLLWRSRLTKTFQDKTLFGF